MGQCLVRFRYAELRELLFTRLFIELMPLVFDFPGSGSRPEPLIIQFADGRFEVPPWVFAVVPRKALEERAPKLASKSFAEFCTWAASQAERNKLNKVQKDFVGAALKGRKYR